MVGVAVWTQMIPATRAFLLALLVLAPLVATSQSVGLSERSLLEEAKRPHISESDLSWHVVALTPEELEEVANSWRDHLRYNLERIALLETQEDAQDDTAREALTELNGQNDAIMDKYSTVLTAWERKGASAEALEEHRAFMNGAVNQLLASADLPTLLRYTFDWLSSWRGGLSVALDLALAIGAIWLFYLLARFFQGRVRASLERRSSISALRRSVFATFAFWTAMLVGAFVVLVKLGFNGATLAAALGGVAFLIGLAMQSTLGNIACGLLIGMFRPFDLGDTIEVGALSGRIERLGIAATRVRRFDNVLVVVPNEELWRNRLSNFSEPDILRVDLVFHIGSGGDEVLAIKVLQDVAEAYSETLSDPATEVFVGEIGEGSIGIYCRPWVKSPAYWRTSWDLTAQGRAALEKAGIKLAYPLVDVRLDRQADEPALRSDIVS